MALAKPIVQFETIEGRVSASAAAVYARPNDPADLADQILSHIGNLHTPGGTHLVRTSEFEISYPIDAQGFNDADPWPATADIVVVGDSLTFGYGAAPGQAWPVLVARKLPGVEMVNLGLIGAGPQQYLRLYETFGIPLKPSIVLIGFFLANDFWDAAMFDAWEKSGAGGSYMISRDFGMMARPVGGDPAGMLRKALHCSYLYGWMWSVEEIYRDWRAAEPEELRLAGGGRVALRWRHLADKTADIEPGNSVFELALRALERIHALATRHGSHLLVVLQPGKEETYLPLLDGTTVDPGAPLRAALDARVSPIWTCCRHIATAPRPERSCSSKSTAPPTWRVTG